ncbi:MAG: hypothetical protein RL115_951 [Bacteroidota bacterium]
MPKMSLLLVFLTGFGLLSFASISSKPIEPTKNKKQKTAVKVKKNNQRWQCFAVEYELTCTSYVGNYCFNTPTNQSVLTEAQWERGWELTNVNKCGSYVPY